MPNSRHRDAPVPSALGERPRRGRRPRAGFPRALGTVVALLAGTWAPLAHAQCTLVSLSDVTFTGFTPFGPGVAATATVAYACPPSVGAAWIGISAPTTPRQLKAGASTLTFELYQGADHAAAWPESPPVAVPASASGSVTIYAFLPQQDAAPGIYQEKLRVRLYSDVPTNETDKAWLTARSDVVATCTISPATLAFGSYDPFDPAPLDAQGTIQIACTRDTSYAVGLGPGNFSAGTRQMANGAARLSYELYTDVGRTAPWTPSTTVGSVAPSTAPIPLVVHGRIPAGQAVPAGSYSDVVQTTINF